MVEILPQHGKSMEASWEPGSARARARTNEEPNLTAIVVAIAGFLKGLKSKKRTWLSQGRRVGITVKYGFSKFI